MGIHGPFYYSILFSKKDDNTIRYELVLNKDQVEICIVESKNPTIPANSRVVLKYKVE